MLLIHQRVTKLRRPLCLQACKQAATVAQSVAVYGLCTYIFYMSATSSG